MRSKSKIAAKVVAFFVILVVLLEALSEIFIPSIDNVDEMTSDFYDQPDNTLQVVFIGTSVFRQGIIPMELYEDYGICSYNLGTSGQPVLTSYYWLQEVYDHHAKTLKTVVFDVSSLQHEWEEEKYITALVRMQNSLNKYHAIRDIQDTLEGFLSYMVPIYAYHDRWKELDKTSYFLDLHNTDSGMRGYDFTLNYHLISADYQTIKPLSYFLESDETEELAEESILYFDKMVNFCKENDLQLILTRTPTNEEDWSDAAHNAIQVLANQYGLEFIDFNYTPYAEELGYNAALDKDDAKHLNYYGARKLTAWLGSYLLEHNEFSDVRKDETYSFMEEEWKEYKRHTLLAELNGIGDVAEYLETVNTYDDFTVFISVKDEGSYHLTEEQRNAFAALGLDGLSLLEYRDSYLAVLESGGGGVVAEMRQQEQESDEETAIQDENAIQNDDETGIASAALTYGGKMNDGTSYRLRSGGKNLGNTSSCVIDGIEYSLQGRGINIVVYDNRLHEVIDSSVFDTFDSAVREVEDLAALYEEQLDEGFQLSQLSGNVRDVYLFQLKQDDAYLTSQLRGSQADLQDWISAFDQEGYLLIFCAKKDGISSLNERELEALTSLGLLEDESKLDYASGWAAVLEDRVIEEEEISYDSGGAVISTEKVYVESGADTQETQEGTEPSILINGEECSPSHDGVNLVIYNTLTNLVVDTVSFGNEGNE